MLNPLQFLERMVHIWEKNQHLKKNKDCPLLRFNCFDHAKTFFIYVKIWTCKLSCFTCDLSNIQNEILKSVHSLGWLLWLWFYPNLKKKNLFKVKILKNKYQEPLVSPKHNTKTTLVKHGDFNIKKNKTNLGHFFPKKIIGYRPFIFLLLSGNIFANKKRLISSGF
jgi:hypothetical protein